LIKKARWSELVQWSTEPALHTRFHFGKYRGKRYSDIAAGDPEAFASYGFVIRVNNLKLNASQLVLDVVSRAMVICGIAGYRNDSRLTLGRHLRDATGAGLMVNNDRILGQNATMQVAIREG